MVNPWKNTDWNPSAKKIRLTMAAIALFAVLIVWLIRRDAAWTDLQKYGWYVLIPLLLGALVPPVGKWIYRIWFLLTGVIGFVVSNLILLICFYLVITPLALIRRMAGGRPLPLKPGPGQSSWADHADRTGDPASYFRQF